MTHEQYIRNCFNILAETENAVFFEACGELCCEINGQEFDCHSVEEFYEMVEQFGDDDFAE